VREAGASAPRRVTDQECVHTPNTTTVHDRPTYGFISTAEPVSCCVMGSHGNALIKRNKGGTGCSIGYSFSLKDI
jgi:hypothetical protein